jgi:hypothetical protein
MANKLFTWFLKTYKLFRFFYTGVFSEGILASGKKFICLWGRGELEGERWRGEGRECGWVGAGLGGGSGVGGAVGGDRRERAMKRERGFGAVPTTREPRGVNGWVRCTCGVSVEGGRWGEMGGLWMPGDSRPGDVGDALLAVPGG